MKTLEKFECRNCIVKIQMLSSKEILDINKKLLKVTTTPKRKNSWKEYSKEFDYSRDANSYFLNEVYEWLH